MKICQRCGKRNYHPEKKCESCGGKFEGQKNDCRPISNYAYEHIDCDGNMVTIPKPLSDEI